MLKFKREPQTYVTHVTDAHVQQVSNAQMAKYAEAFLCDLDYMGLTDAFTAAYRFEHGTVFFGNLR